MRTSDSRKRTPNNLGSLQGAPPGPGRPHGTEFSYRIAPQLKYSLK